MISAASAAVAALADPTTPGAPLLALMDDLRTVAATVATAAARDGSARTTLHNPIQQVTDAMWRIEYPQLDLTGQ